MDIITEEFQLGELQFSLETGRVARQADGAVIIRQGANLVLATVVAASEDQEGDFLPLTVEFRERMASAGRIPGSYGRREGRITERETLVSRRIDRSLRPLFPKHFRCETHLHVMVHSADSSGDLESLALLAAAAAVHISDIPFSGPVAGLRAIQSAETGLSLCPSPKAEAKADIALMITATREGLVMLDGGGNEVDDDALSTMIDQVMKSLQGPLDALDSLRERAGRPKRKLPKPTHDTLETQLRSHASDAVDDALSQRQERERTQALAELAETLHAELAPELKRQTFERAFERLVATQHRHAILGGRRLDGRGYGDIRALDCEVAFLASAHGSALFTRGHTQALVSATLASGDDNLTTETIFGRVNDRFILHYNFPGFAVGQARGHRGPGRRELGHGALARRALRPVLPSREAFPYTVRLVSDITESNGSSSMATICGGSLALMDAGVPIKAPVAGIAMGLIKEGERVAVLTDILADEDHVGDMDLKVAGTPQGLTALQLDNKLGSLPPHLLREALAQARQAHHDLFSAMNACLASARDQVAESAPQYLRMRIPPSLVGAVIGSGGKNIQDLQSRTGSRIDVTKDGEVRIFGRQRKGVNKARQLIEGLTLELRQNGLYTAKVVTVKDYGVFVRVGHHEALVHVSELEDQPQAFTPGDSCLIRVIGVDGRGRLRFSQKAAAGAKASEALNA